MPCSIVRDRKKRDETSLIERNTLLLHEDFLGNFSGSADAIVNLNRAFDHAFKSIADFDTALTNKHT